NVLANRHGLHQALKATIFRHVGDAEVTGQAGRVDLHGLAFEEDFAGGRGRHAEKRESQFGSPAPYQTGNAQDFSATQREGNIADMPTMIQIPDFEHRLADGCIRLWKQAVERSPDHHRNELPFIDLADLPSANA